MEGFEDSRRLPAAWECDETNLSSLSETSEQADQILEITEEELIEVQIGPLCVICSHLLSSPFAFARHFMAHSPSCSLTCKMSADQPS